MTSVKRTPDEALKAVQTLWPHIQSIRKPPNGTHVCWDCGGTSAIEVEWPKGVTEWPNPDKELEGTRQAKMPDDFWKAAIFRATVNGPIFTGRLVGRTPSASVAQDGWLCYDERGVTVAYRFCYIKENATPRASESDPGEGYRLIDKSTDVPQPGDEYWSRCDNDWKRRGQPTSEPFYKSDTYRRKIVTYRHGVTASSGYRLLDQGEPVTETTQIWLPALEGWYYTKSPSGDQAFDFVYQTPIK